MNEKSFLIISILGIIGVAGALYYFFSFDKQFKTILKDLKDLKEKTTKEHQEPQKEFSVLDTVDSYVSNIQEEFEILENQFDETSSDKIVELGSCNESDKEIEKEDKDKRVNDILNFICQEPQELQGLEQNQLNENTTEPQGLEQNQLNENTTEPQGLEQTEPEFQHVITTCKKKPLNSKKPGKKSIKYSQ